MVIALTYWDWLFEAGLVFPRVSVYFKTSENDPDKISVRIFPCL